MELIDLEDDTIDAAILESMCSTCNLLRVSSFKVLVGKTSPREVS
jgi:hypothetical protein